MGLYVKDGKWCYTFQIKGQREYGNTQIPFNGKTSELGKIIENGSNKKIADKIFQKDRINFIEGKKFEYVSTITFKELLLNYLLKPEVKKHGCYKKTDRPAVASLNSFFGSTIMAAQMTKEHFDKWHIWMTEKKENPVKGNTFNRYLTVAHACFESAIKEKILKENPCKGVYRYNEDDFSRNKVFSRDMLLALWEKLSVKMRDIIIVAVMTGMRKGELRNLRWEFLDTENKILKIPRKLTKEKTKTKIITLHDNVFEIIQKQPQTSPYIFSDSKGQQLKDGGMIRTEFDRIKKKLNIKDLRFHDLRHTFGTEFYKSSRDIKAVQHAMGHSNIEITSQVYTNLDTDYLRKQINKIPSFLSGIKPEAQKKCYAGVTINMDKIGYSKN